MRLKRVRIFGFKTFADRTEVSLEGGVIAVVGPNGCGKSNIVDAILWGLGEGNARHLRAVHSQDVIFNGAANRKPLGFAEVSLLFDNEDGKLPVDTPEVSITRRLTRAGDSEYQINKRPCRLRDIYDLLADSGLGRAGYAIVGQKEIDTALSASADDRRGWVDEAAGVQRYRVRKVESLKRLATAQEHLSRVSDILRELESQREPLREEAEIALRYKSLLGSLREIEIGLLADEISTSIAELKEQAARIEECARVSLIETQRAEELERQVQTVGNAISDLERELDTIRGLQQGSLTALERSEAHLRLLSQQVLGLDEQEKLLAEDGQNVAKRIVEGEREHADLAAEALLEATALEELRRELTGVGEDAQRLSAELKQIETDLEEGRRQHSRRLRQEAERAHADDRIKQIRRELQGIQGAIPELDEGIAAAQLAFDEVNGQSETQTGEIKALETQLISLRNEEDRDAQAVRKALSERAALEGRKRGIEATIDAHEGLAQGTKAVLEAVERKLLQGEYTPVGGAIEVDKELALAIETALGGSANDLICNDPADAKTAVEWLKHHRAGRATFQPIPLMRPVEPSYELKRLLSERGMVGRASELVSCKSRHRPVIDSLLGRVVIVEDLDVALRHARTSGWSRMVTLEGEVVHSSGAVTGGQQSRQGYGMVQRKADLAELLDEMARQDTLVRQHEVRTAERTRSRRNVEAAIQTIRDEIGTRQAEIRDARQYLQALLDERKSSERSGEKLQRELDSLAAGAETTEVAIDLPALEAKRDGAIRVMASRSADAEQAEARLRESESRASQAAGRVEIAYRRLRSARDAEENRQRRLQNLEPDRIRIEAERLNTESARLQAASEKAQADRRLEQAQLERRECLEESLRLAEQAKSARANVTAVADAAHQAEIGRARAESRRSTALQRLFEEYSMGEEDALAQVGLHEVPSDAHAVVQKLRRDLRAMGDVNLGAIEAFERLSNRFEELEAQSNDVLEGIDQVETSIRELDRLTRDRFIKTFGEVEVAFTEMFQKLFGGGEGKLALTDSEHVLDSGIELQITLPGKKRQALQLLSGGERSLCAMAFLFALLKVKPSPLVVLDEVDAPLDGRNVERFGSTLLELTESTQFIVITHNPTTIEMAGVMLGVSMQEPGVSVLLPVKLPN